MASGGARDDAIGGAHGENESPVSSNTTNNMTPNEDAMNPNKILPQEDEQGQVETTTTREALAKRMPDDMDGDENRQAILSASISDSNIGVPSVETIAAAVVVVEDHKDSENVAILIPKEDNVGVSTPLKQQLNHLPSDSSVETKLIDLNEKEHEHDPPTPVPTSESAPNLNYLGTTTTTSVSTPLRNEAFSTEPLQTPNTAPSLRNDSADENPDTASLHYTNGVDSSFLSTATVSTTTSGNSGSRSTSKASSTAKTLVALFGGPSSIAPLNGDVSNLLAAQHDYTLVGDSPYETTYDPRSPYYYNRVYGQLYITTISVMFRGKAFGPMGAIPYERRILLPFWETASIEAYKTTSLKIRMKDGEQYVFKSFADREAVVKLMKRTRKRCCGSGNRSNPNYNHDGHPQETTSNANRSFDSCIGAVDSPGAVETFSRSSPHYNDVRRRSSSMPSSLRGPKATRTPSSASSSRRNSVVFDDTVSATPKATNYRNETSPEKRIPVLSLRLSNAVDDRKDPDPNDASRRLFDAEAAGAAHAASIMSPPRTTILQRRQPKTPMVIGDATKPTTTSNEQHPSQPLTSITGVKASIPRIPTVPTLNTPEPRLKKPLVAIVSGSSNSDESTTMPVSMPGATDGVNSNIDVSMVPRLDILDTPVLAAAENVAAVTNNRLSTELLPNDISVGTKKADFPQNDDKAQKLWLAAKTRTTKSQNDWKEALQPTRLPNCTLNDWFDLFFSDDAPFSLARYQIETIGDRAVQFESWRRSASKIDDGIPQLEREIRYIHPIEGAGRVMGPSEAETFRKQSLKRYGNFGAILTNVTTVGKTVPMADCFRVEDQWIIEQEKGQHLTLSVSFRLVFVKRTMFKGMIQKNVQSETKKWFQGYATMIQTALASEEHLSQKRKQQTPFSSSEATMTTAGLSPSSSSTLPIDGLDAAAATTSILAQEEDGRMHRIDTYAVTDERFFDEGAKKQSEYILSSQWGTSLVGWKLLLFVFVVALLLLLFRLSLQVTSLGNNLVALEEQLGEMRQQNARLIQQMEDMSKEVVAFTAARAE